MPAKRTSSPPNSNNSKKPYGKTEKVSKGKSTTSSPNTSTPPNWQAHVRFSLFQTPVQFRLIALEYVQQFPEWSSEMPEGEHAKRCIDKWLLLPPYDHAITEDQWESYFKERSALDELNTFGSDASSSIQPDELRPPLRVLEDSAANLAATIYGSVLAEESKISIARTLRGSLYITAADGMEDCFTVNTRLYSPFGIGTSVDLAYSYSFDYRESDFFGLLVATSNKVGDIDAENPSKCKALTEDGSPRPKSVELFSWNGGKKVGAAKAADLNSFEHTLFGSTGWLSPLKLHDLLLAASTCSQYDDCYQELETDIAVASSKKLAFFEGETTGGELGEAETTLYKELRQNMLGENAEGDVDDDQPGCVPDRLLLLARHE